MLKIGVANVRFFKNMQLILARNSIEIYPIEIFKRALVIKNYSIF